MSSLDAGARIPQAIVTDPAETGSSGYTLVAWSPGAPVPERERLGARPEVTDYLHRRELGRAFYSFYRLSDAWWALVKRFQHGKSRGASNRVVAHGLLLTREVLASVVDDPWLLISKSRYASASGGDPMPLSQLSEAALAATGESLPDLRPIVPESPSTERHAAQRRRVAYLCKAEGKATVEARLGQIYVALASDRRVMLPQGQLGEQLLWAAWSGLPRADRLRVPWSTHLAAGLGRHFRLVATPEPERARQQEDDPASWVVLGEGGAASQPGAALAAAVVSEEVELDDLYGQLDRHRRSLCGGPEGARDLARSILLQRFGQEVAPRAGVPALEEYLDRRHLNEPAALAMPELDRTRLLALVASTAGELAARQPSGHAMREIAQALRARGLAEGLLSGEGVRDLVAADGAAQPAVLWGAIALTESTLPPPPAGREQREALLSVAIESPAEARGAGPQVASLVELAIGLGRCGSDRLAEAIALLGRFETGLALLADRVDPARGEDMTLAAALLLEPAHGDAAVLARVARGYLVPALARAAGRQRAVRADLLTAGLSALRQSPVGLVDALEIWDDGLYERALAELGPWIREDPELARQVGKAVIGRREGRVARPFSPVCGVALALAKAGAPVAAWLEFALAEAVWLDRDGRLSERSALQSLLRDHGAALAADSTASAERVTRHLLDGELPSAQLGRAHRFLVRVLAPVLCRLPREMGRLVTRVSRLELEEFLAWGPAFLQLAEATQARPDRASASWLAANWCRALAARRPTALPRELGAFLGLLQQAEREHVVRDLGLMAGMLRDPGERKWLSRRLRELVAAGSGALLEIEIVDLSRRETLRDARGQVRIEQLAETVQEAADIFHRAGRPREDLAVALRGVLPERPEARPELVLELLDSAALMPRTRRCLREMLLDALRTGGIDARQRLMTTLDPSAGDHLVTLGLARLFGRRWVEGSRLAQEFLERLLSAQRYDAAGVFLRASHEEEEGFLRTIRKEKDLARRLREAARDHVHRWDLEPFTRRIRRLPV